jgi:hypothetical protein
MDYFYSDYGNHELWSSSLQGGSFCRVHQLYRYFYGFKDIYACIGSDNFRLDTQTKLNTNGSLGELLDGYGDIPFNEVRVSPVGIIEDENSEHGRYFMMKYIGDAENRPTFTGLAVLNSEYGDELTSTTLDDAWIPQSTVIRGAEQGMRVVNVAGDEPAANSTFLYYLESTAVATSVYFVAIPDAGEPASTVSPIKVATLDILAKNRFYAVPMEDGLVGLYVGDNDKAQTRRTVALVHDPRSGVVTTDPYTLIVDSLPFPRSYAGCRGRGDEVHLILEPAASWREGWGTLESDRPDTEAEDVPPRMKSSGNKWVITSLIEGGRVLEDQIPFDGTDVQPWMGASWADSLGGRRRASVSPWFICRQTSPPEKFSDTHNSYVEEDTSYNYMLIATVGVRQQADDEENAFLQRADSITSLKPHFGNHRSTSGWVNTSDQPYVPGQSLPTERVLLDMMVPGSILLEPIETEPVGTFTPIITLGTQANRLDNWRLIDDNAPYGQTNTGVIPPASPPEGHSSHNASTDCMHGAKASLFDDEYGVIVGWFYNGFPEQEP